MSSWKFGGVFGTFLALTNAQAAPAVQRAIPQNLRQDTVQIAEDSGGEIIEYLLKQAQFRESQTRLQFTGRCDSACTLYLGLPQGQLCLTHEAYFRFHLPIADDEKTVRDAERILLMKYPVWVKSWINANHGLTTDLLTMDYAYASRFLKNCETSAKTGTGDVPVPRQPDAG